MERPEDGGQYEAGNNLQLVPGRQHPVGLGRRIFCTPVRTLNLPDRAGGLMEWPLFMEPDSPRGGFSAGANHRREVRGLTTALADMGNMTGNLILDSKGNLYGTTQDSGRHNAGLVFALKPPAASG